MPYPFLLALNTFAEGILKKAPQKVRLFLSFIGNITSA